MGNIVLLDDLTINKIAAGEVIERPANVVKELVENSIDAGANQITVEIRNGGKTYIRVKDNGSGIGKDQLPLALERHATSKIRKIEDLENTYTMGFRGEALASIASICKFTIKSRTEDEYFQSVLKTEAGSFVDFEESVGPVGTEMIVEEIFFNVPVRYNFLKNDSTEFRYIKEMLEKIAIANPNISFEFINNKQKVFKTPGNGKLEDLVYIIFGKKISQNLVNVDFSMGDIKVSGVIGNTTIAMETRKDELFFLNNRYINNQILYSSADQAFKGDTGIGKHGFLILNISMPASGYDVNVHPTKKEVRFKDENEVYKVVYQAIKTAILSKKFLGDDSASDEENQEYVKNEFEFLTNNFASKGFENDAIIESINAPYKEEAASKDLITRNQKRDIKYKFIGICFKTYIIIQIDNEIYFIDQHAAHERILYEQIKNNYKANLDGNVQMILMPEIVELPHKDIEFVRRNAEIIKGAGFDIDFFGDNAVKINGVPDIEYKTKITRKQLFLDILDEMITSERTANKDIEERFIATVACKAAVKAGMDLTREEVDFLIQNLLILKNPFTCPHGRPTTIRFTKSEIEKMKV